MTSCFANQLVNVIVSGMRYLKKMSDYCLLPHLVLLAVNIEPGEVMAKVGYQLLSLCSFVWKFAIEAIHALNHSCLIFEMDTDH